QARNERKRNDSRALFAGVQRQLDVDSIKGLRAVGNLGRRNTSRPRQAQPRADQLTIPGKQLALLERDRFVWLRGEPEMRGRSIRRRVARRELDHQNGRSFFAASRVIRRERAGKKRRKALLGVLDTVRPPRRKGDREIVFQHGLR